MHELKATIQGRLCRLVIGPYCSSFSFFISFIFWVGFWCEWVLSLWWIWVCGFVIRGWWWWGLQLLLGWFASGDCGWMGLGHDDWRPKTEMQHKHSEFLNSERSWCWVLAFSVIFLEFVGSDCSISSPIASLVNLWIFYKLGLIIVFGI